MKNKILLTSHYKHRFMKKTLSLLLLFSLLLTQLMFLSGCGKEESDDVLTLRICNWEEYIDEGDWDEEETIDLPGGDIIGENSMVDDFIKWYKAAYGKDIKVEYSCFGSNEELYNQLTIGDTFDLVCPSEYMIMKLMSEDAVEPFSEEFWDETKDKNYYAKGVSPYIKNFVKTVTVNGKSIAKYAAGYMWGTTGIVYNPEKVTPEEASSWSILFNDKFKHQVTIKDNVRDSYFAAIGHVKADELKALQEEYQSQKENDQDGSIYAEYHQKFTNLMNDVSPKTMKEAEKELSKGRTNFYSFESDSGKSDMVTGKVAANYQWSGDAVYSLDQAEEDDFYLEYAVPEESSNLWFDGWAMLKKGIGDNAEKKQACEAWVNFMSRPDNVVRNMYYIGYTSVIAGGDDSTIFDYADWCYSAEDDEEDVVDYDVSYFFGNEDAVITTPEEQTRRQLFGQYPTKEVLERCSIMDYFGEDATERLNQMWIDVRCFNPFDK